MTSEIRVYASFPRVVIHDFDINLDPTNWHWVHCLDFPVEKLHEFSCRPYKWIRYAIGVVVGAQGDLSLNADSLNIINYNATPVKGESTKLYYHLIDNERRRIFPVDPKGIRTTSTITSSDSSRGSEFRTSVSKRDKGLCVLTEVISEGCDAVHLLPASKGDEYIHNVTRRRSRDLAHGDVIEDIDDVRNGLFLNAMTHRVIGRDIAFLQTPNFAMDTSDVDSTGTALQGEKRCTTHVFNPRMLQLLAGRPSGTPIRMSDTPDWPPALLFDITYAHAIVHHFGTQSLTDVITSTWTDVFYPDRGMKKQPKERPSRADRRRPDIMDMLLFLPYCLLPPDDVSAYFRHAEERAEEAETPREDARAGKSRDLAKAYSRFGTVIIVTFALLPTAIIKLIN